MRMTHALVTASGLILLQGIGGAGVRAQSTDAKATAVLAQARKALGGEQKLASVKGLSIRGSYRREASMPASGGGGGSVVGPVVLVGGALLLGLVVGNPGNEAVVLVGTLLPGALLLALEPHHGCIARLGLLIFLNVGVGIG